MCVCVLAVARLYARDIVRRCMMGPTKLQRLHCWSSRRWTRHLDPRAGGSSNFGHHRAPFFMATVSSYFWNGDVWKGLAAMVTQVWNALPIPAESTTVSIALSHQCPIMFSCVRPLWIPVHFWTVQRYGWKMIWLKTTYKLWEVTSHCMSHGSWKGISS